MSANFLDKNFGRFGNRCFQSFYLYTQFRDGNIPNWYLQDCKYFDKYRAELQQMFGQGQKDDRISIHVRLGKNPSNPDEPAYMNNPFYVDLTSTLYYQRAMNLFPNDRFLIFSDDIEFCTGIFGGFDISFSEGKTEEEDFRAMANCKGRIIANSSFS